MSPRIRQEPEIIASQVESKLKTLISEKGEEGPSHSEEDARINADTEGSNTSEKAPVDDQTKKCSLNLEHAERTADGNQGNVLSLLERMGSRNCYLRDTARVKESPETNKSDGNSPGQTLQTRTKFVTSLGAAWSHKGMPPSSLSAQTVNRAVSPLKTSQFVDLADYHKYVPQPPKARALGQLGGGSRLAVKENKNEEHIDR